MLYKTEAEKLRIGVMFKNPTLELKASIADYERKQKQPEQRNWITGNVYYRKCLTCRDSYFGASYSICQGCIEIYESIKNQEDKNKKEIKVM